MKIQIDQENCIGCGSCTALADNTFELNEEGKVAVKNEGGNSDEEILSAAKSCPVSVITLTNDEGKKLWPEA